MKQIKIILILTIALLIIIPITTESINATPTIKIPTINVDEEINNETIDKGVLIDPKENIPTKNPIILFGHRSTHNAPFLKLDQLKKGDKIILDWTQKEEYNYTVTKKEILPGNSKLNIKKNNTIYLITCDPIGSTKNRLIITGKLNIN